MAERLQAPVNLWLVRMGDGGAALGDCVRAGVAALDYLTVPDARGLLVPEIAEALRSSSRTDPTAAANMLYDFAHEVNVGDVVVSPHLDSASVYFGEVAGSYEWLAPGPVDGHLHYRRVTWWGSLSRTDDLPEIRLLDLDREPTFYAMPNRDWWLEHAHLARDITTEVIPPVNAEPPPPEARAATPRKASTPRKAAAPKAPPVPKAPPAPTTQLCSMCGMRKPVAIVLDGMCADCRADLG